MNDPIEHVTLIKRSFQSVMAISQLEIQYAVNIEAHYDVMTRNLLTRLNAYVWAEHLGQMNFPSSWWQHFKRDKMPKWFVKRWPVKVTTYDANRMYPNITIPHEKSVARIFLRPNSELHGFGGDD